MKPNSLQNPNIEERSVNEIAKKTYENSAEVIKFWTIQIRTWAIWVDI